MTTIADPEYIIAPVQTKRPFHALLHPGWIAHLEARISSRQREVAALEGFLESLAPVMVPACRHRVDLQRELDDLRASAARDLRRERGLLEQWRVAQERIAGGLTMWMVEPASILGYYPRNAPDPYPWGRRRDGQVVFHPRELARVRMPELCGTHRSVLVPAQVLFARVDVPGGDRPHLT